jgi:threonyl-tRNA synthetase
VSEELPENDHRRLGRRLNLFHLQEEAQGSVFWHPLGATLFQIVQDHIRSKLKRAGYDEVRSPQVYDRSLWERSGHWDNYSDAMFRVGEDLILKPMNCPAHVQIFNAQALSYRQLPMRLAEFGCCHRNEPSGSLHGIMRVRQFTQDDAHIFCQEDQIADEVRRFCGLLLSVYEDFGFHDVEVGFSTRPDVRAGSDEVWDRAEAALASTVQAAGLSYVVQPGEGAFYGPKLEFALRDRHGRSWQCGTVQLDFVLPDRLGARYVGQDGQHHTPVMVHRAILGSLERFIGILLEHYEGRLPGWLAPVQVSVISIAPDSVEYARRVAREFEEAGLRVDLDVRDENVSQKVKEHLLMAVPYIAAVGRREAEAETVALRERGQAKQNVMSIDWAIQRIARRSNQAPG